MSDIAVVSACAGGYDKPLDRPGVQMLDVPLDGEHPRLAAKRPKMLDIRPGGDYSHITWIDANMTIVSPTFAEDVVKACGKAPLALWQHPDRHNIRDEAEASYVLAPEKYADQPLRKQVAHYHDQGFLDNWGLFATGVLVWNLEHPGAESIAKAWLAENRAWSYQDQISLPYVLWREQLMPQALPYNLRQNPWVSIGGHLSNR